MNTNSPKPTLLLLPGATMGAWLFDVAPEWLNNHYRIVKLDNPGVGGKPYNHIRRIQDVALDALATLEALGAEKAYVLGHSKGGFVAQEMALLAPEKVEKLILVSTCMGQPWLARDFAQLVKNPTEAAQLMGEGEASEAGVKEILVHSNMQQQIPDLLQWFIQTRAKHWPPKEVRRLHMQLASKFSTMGRAHRIQQPALVVHGTDDQLVRLKSAKAMAGQLQNARLLTYPHTKHMPMLEVPHFWEDIHAFLQNKPVGEAVTPDMPYKLPLQDEITSASEKIRAGWQQWRKMWQNI